MRGKYVETLLWNGPFLHSGHTFPLNYLLQTALIRGSGGGGVLRRLNRME